MRKEVVNSNMLSRQPPHSPQMSERCPVSSPREEQDEALAIMGGPVGANN